MKEAFIVTLGGMSHAPRPKYGPFIWSNTHKRYVWRDEVASSMGQLADLFNQASDYMRGKGSRLRIWAVQVAPSEADPQRDSEGEPESEIETPNAERRTSNVELEALDTLPREPDEAAPPAAKGKLKVLTGTVVKPGTGTPT